ncbi:MAG: type VI secretion system baseplate subunit TssG [Amphritea sp.]
MSLAAQLGKHPQRLEFVQVIRLLRRLAQTRDIRFCAEPMPVGNAPEVLAIDESGAATQVRLGLEALSGVKGVLPDYLYEELLSSLHDEDQALNDFLDIFNHRFYQLQHGVQEKGNLLLRDEQEMVDSDALTRDTQRCSLTRLSALPVTAVNDASLLSYSVLMGLKVRSLASLRQMLSDYFELQIQLDVESHSRHRLPDSSVTRLTTDGQQNNRLGQGLLLGRTASLHYHRLEVRVVPSDQEEFMRLQADSHFAGRLRELTQAYLGEATELKLYLYVKRAFISKPILSSRSQAAVRLGEANCLAPQLRPQEYRKILIQ